MKTRNRTRKRRCSGTRVGKIEIRTRRLRCAAQRRDSSKMTRSSASFLVETWRCESRFRFVGARALKKRKRDTYIFVQFLGEFVKKNFSLLSLHSFFKRVRTRVIIYSHTLRKRNLTLSASIHNGRGRVDDDDDDFVLLVEKNAPE